MPFLWPPKSDFLISAFCSRDDILVVDIINQRIMAQGQSKDESGGPEGGSLDVKGWQFNSLLKQQILN